MKSGSRLILAAAILLAASRIASAQQFSLPPLAPPPVALAVPRPLAPPAGSLDLYARSDNFHTIAPQQQLPLFIPGPVGYVPAYVLGHGTQNISAPPTSNPGGIRFETRPGSAQVYVDGYYTGIVDDYGISGRILDLSVGPHRIDLQVSGYLTLSFQVNIAPNQIVRYRGDLQRLTPPPSPPPASAPLARTSVYVIPNCYAGNRPPRTALPRGCNPRDMRVQESQR